MSANTTGEKQCATVALADAGPVPSERGIVVGFDGSEPAHHALRWAIAEAHRRQVGCRVIEAWTPGSIRPFDPRTQHDRLDERLAHEQTLLAAVVEDERTESGAIPSAEVLLLPGDAVDVLAHAGEQAEFLVVGSRGHGGLKSLVPGSVSSDLLHRAVCPTVVVPAGANLDEHFHRVVVGIDGSEQGARALAWAREEAGIRHAELVVLHAWHVPVVMASPYAPTAVVSSEECRRSAESILAAAVAATAGGCAGEPGAGVTVIAQMFEGGPDLGLLKAADTADLLVVGSRGRGGLAAALLGSTSRGCVHHSPCPVVVVP